MSSREFYTNYIILKGVEQPLIFHGLQGFYIWVAGIGLLINFLLFTLLYLLGIDLLICVGMVLCLCVGWVILISRHSRQYGSHGWMKKMASTMIPTRIQL